MKLTTNLIILIGYLLYTILFLIAVYGFFSTSFTTGILKIIGMTSFCGCGSLFILTTYYGFYKKGFKFIGWAIAGGILLPIISIDFLAMFLQ